MPKKCNKLSDMTDEQLWGCLKAAYYLAGSYSNEQAIILWCQIAREAERRQSPGEYADRLFDTIGVFPQVRTDGIEIQILSPEDLEGACPYFQKLRDQARIARLPS